jgi:hypothetical protein
MPPPSDQSSRPGASARVVRLYLIGHVLALVAYWFVPMGSWAHPFWQAIVNSFSAAFLVIGARRLRPEATRAWYFIAAGICLNAWGVVVEMVVRRFFDIQTSPNAADAFWSALFPAVVVGLGMLVHRAVAREDVGTMLRNTVICVPVTFFIGIYAWQLVAWRTHHDESVALVYKIVVTAYPFGDLMFVALLLRLVLSVGVRNVSIWLMLGWLLLLFPSDLGWPMFVRTKTDPSRAIQYLMEGSWMVASALMGAATWHPDVRAITRPTEGRPQRLGAFGWSSLLACLLVSPLVVLLQALLDRLYFLTSF